MSKVPMTAIGAEKLKAELNDLKSQARPRVIKAIAEARAHGDLKENAEYHAAREQQGFIEGRIRELESKISLAQIIDVKSLPTDDRVIFGSTVCVVDEETGDEMRYQIVGEDEADIKQGQISFSSPMARALIGKREGDIAEFEAPGGIRSLEIVKVEYI